MTEKLKTYTGVATIFYQQEAQGIYKVQAASDEEAIKKIREILSDKRITWEAESFDDIDKWFNIQGRFCVYNSDSVPDDDDEAEKLLIAEDEDFESYR